MLCPIKRPLTPNTTVSRPRVIVDLALGLMKKGHQVTLVGTKDSYLPGATTIGVVPKGLNFLPAPENEFYQHTSYLTLMIAELVKRQVEFDIIHNHMYPEYLPLLALDSLKTPCITTVHSQMIPLTVQVLRQFPIAHLVAISHMAQKASGIGTMRVVHNSVDTELFQPDDTPSKTYLLAVGRMSKAKNKDGSFMDPKGIQNAIKVAQVSGERLKIVGNVEDPKFFETLVKPHLSDKIEFVGEVSPEQKLTREEMVKLFVGAKAFINAINWEEPFGLVMAEALACGTPVIAYNRGAVAEIVKDGVTGFTVEPDISHLGDLGHLKIQKRGLDALVEAVSRIGEIDRAACRKHAVTHFSTERMVEEYEQLYKQLVTTKTPTGILDL